MNIEEILRREKEEMKATIKKMVERLSFSLRIENDGSEKLRVRKALRILKNRGEIIDFLEDRKPYRDFIVIIISELRKKYEYFNLKIVRTEEKAREFQVREKMIRNRLKRRKFVESIPVIVNKEVKDSKITEQIRKIIKEKKKS